MIRLFGVTYGVKTNIEAAAKLPCTFIVGTLTVLEAVVLAHFDCSICHSS